MAEARASAVDGRLVRGRHEAAQRAAQLAAADLAARRYDDAIAHAGIALEHILKAYLVKRHPLLIVDAPQGRLNISGMIWALGDGPQVPPTMRTITAQEALNRSCGLVPELDAQALKIVIQARNGALHTGQSDAAAGEVIASVAQAAAVLLPSIGQDTRWLWGNYFDAVTGRINQKRSEIASRVADRLAQARENLEVLLKTQGVEALNALHALTQAYQLADDEVGQDCPVCNALAVVSGRVEIDEGEEPDDDEDDNPWSLSSAPMYAYLRPLMLRCRLCGLKLNGPAQLRAANTDTSPRPATMTLELAEMGVVPVEVTDSVS